MRPPPQEFLAGLRSMEAPLISEIKALVDNGSDAEVAKEMKRLKALRYLIASEEREVRAYEIGARMLGLTPA